MLSKYAMSLCDNGIKKQNGVEQLEPIEPSKEEKLSTLVIARQKPSYGTFLGPQIPDDPFNPDFRGGELCSPHDFA